MRKNVLIIIITLFAISSCTGRKRNLDSNEEFMALHTDSLDNAFNSEFCLCVYEYIQNTKKSFAGDSMCYSVCFFTKKTINYFTIWTEYVSYEGRTEYDNSISNYVKINDTDILIIGKEMQSCRCCNFLIQKDNIYKRKDNIVYTEFIYKKQLNVETYRYSLQNGKYVLDKLDFPIIDMKSS